jgi:hypothetical protein
LNAKRARKPSQKATESATTAQQRKKQQKAPQVVPKIIAPLPQSDFAYISDEEAAFLQQQEAIRNGQVEVIPSSPPQLPGIEIGSAWEVQIEGEKEPESNRSTTRLLGNSLFLAFTEWVKEETESFPPLAIGQVYKVVTIWGRASHEKLPKGQVMSSKVKSEQQVLELEDLIKSWSTKWPKRLYCLDLTAIVHAQLDETVYASTEGTPQVTATPGLGPEPQHTPHPSSTPQTGRRTATQMQALVVGDRVAAEEAAGNFIVTITQRWSCTNTNCGNETYCPPAIFAKVLPAIVHSACSWTC